MSCRKKTQEQKEERQREELGHKDSERKSNSQEQPRRVPPDTGGRRSRPSSSKSVGEKGQS